MKNEPHILVIDDDHDLREFLCLVLTREGYAVTGYSSPAVALENLRLGSLLPSLMLVDLQMDEMKGTEFIRFKKEISLNSIGHCPVMMISSSPEEVESGEQDLFKTMMSKPLDMKSLLELVKMYTA